MINNDDTVRRVLDLATAYRLAEHPQIALSELEAAIRALASGGGDGEAVALYTWEVRQAATELGPWTSWMPMRLAPSKSFTRDHIRQIETMVTPGHYCEVRALGVIGGAGEVPAGWPPLNDAMRAVLVNEKCVYGSPEELYSAFIAASPRALHVGGSPLAVWFDSMPETNGKRNWTVILHRGELHEGMTFHRSEYYDRARYDADCLKHLLGLIDKRPFILDYDENLREPTPAEEGDQR